MTERRSTRSKRQVDYSALCNYNDHDDDDFTTTLTPPVAKKATKSNNENKVNKEGSVAKRKSEIRVGVDDRVQEKDLQLALELSRQSSVECCISPIKPECTPQKSPVSSTTQSDGDSSSEFNESESDDSDDNYIEEDSDFDEHLSITNSKAKTKPVTPAARSKPKTAVKDKTCKKTTAVVEKPRPNVAVSRKSTSSSITSPCPSRVAVSRKQAWIPPSPASSSISKSPLVDIKSKSPGAWSRNGISSLGGVSLKSPSSGLRLGLSRNQNVRALHPKVKAQQ